MNTDLPISVVIITKNESRVLAECIASVAFSSDVIVVDSMSTDGTQAIAKKLGARVFERTWEGYGSQKNFGIEQARYDWVLFLDADERISDSLHATLANTLPRLSKNVYWITIVDVFLNKKLLHLVGHNPRLIRKGTAHWNTAHVHEKMMYADNSTLAQYKDGVSGEIQEPIIHQSYTTIAAYVKKMHRYTSLDAAEMQKTHRHRSGRPVKKTAVLPCALALRQFGKLLVYRGGILDGWQGIVWCALSGYYEFEMAKKYLSL